MLEPFLSDHDLFLMFFYECLPEEQKALFIKVLRITETAIVVAMVFVCLFLILKTYIAHRNVKTSTKLKLTFVNLGLFSFLFLLWKCPPAPVWDYLKDYGFEGRDSYARFAFLVIDIFISPRNVIYYGGIFALVGVDKLRYAVKYAYLPPNASGYLLITPLALMYAFVPIGIMTDGYNVSLSNVARADLSGLFSLILPRLLLAISSVAYGIVFDIPFKIPEPYYSAIENKPKKKSFFQTELGTELFLTAAGILFFALPGSVSMYIMIDYWLQAPPLFHKVVLVFMIGCFAFCDVAVVVRVLKTVKLLVTRSK